ncbi:MAG: DUF488 family protein [Dehalococcoidia bacterium]|nr:DUF488 family protein [Dehalococcoidia bacterium]
MPVVTKRVYDDPAPEDGYRVLVDRLWPRGVSKQRAALDAWERTLAPSNELRRWYGHEPERWPEFDRRYRAELLRPEANSLLDDLARRARKEKVTLLFAAKDGERCNAAVVAAVLRERQGADPS